MSEPLVDLPTMENAAWDGRVYFSTPSGEDPVWPPPPEDRSGFEDPHTVALGPSRELYLGNSEFDYIPPDPPWGTYPPNFDVPVSFATYHSRRVGFVTFDVSNVDVDAMPGTDLVLRLDMDDSFGIGGHIFAFGMLARVALGEPTPWVTYGPDEHTNMTTIQVDWIGGSFDDMVDPDDFRDIMLAKASQWPFNSDAGEINLLSITEVDDTGNGNLIGPTVEYIEIRVPNWRDRVRESDWITFLFSAKEEPEPFWIWGEAEFEDFDHGTFIDRLYVQYYPAIEFISGHPLEQISLQVVLKEEEEIPRHPEVGQKFITGNVTISVKASGRIETMLDDGLPTRRITNHRAKKDRLRL